jgi:3-hydroxybutyryl-CoA dehydrogenase
MDKNKALKPADLNRIVIVGTGLMGPGIACRAALAGHSVVLVDRDKSIAESGVERARGHIAELVDGGLAGKTAAEDACERFVVADSAEEACRSADLVVEAVSENLELKRGLFRDLDRWTPPEGIIVSNTSGLSITEICREARNKNRIATAHFWFPAHLVPLVEIVMTKETTDETAGRLKKLFTSWGKAPVVVQKDRPGQLANRILQAVIREAAYIVQEGLATAEDVDTAIKNGPGFRFPVWGPLEHIDAVGLKLALSVQDGVLPGLDNEPHAPEILRGFVEEGRDGYATGRGFYDWTVKDMDALAAERDAFIMEVLRRRGD